MTTPITGPFISYPTGSFATMRRSSYRQKPPYNLPLDFSYYRYFGIAKWGSTWGSSGSVKQADFGSSTFADKAQTLAFTYNQAYSRFKAQVSDSAGWAENLAQINKTRRSIIDRSVQLGSFALALRKGDFNRAAKVLRTPIPSGVSHRKAASQNFLEWEYGVKPLISDLQSSIKILTSDPGSRPIRSKASGRCSQYRNTFQYLPNKNWSRVYEATTARLDITLRGNVRITNPNLFLANQLGILDVALPWKLIPFSFVVDWFINVEQVLSSATDWYGLSLEQAHRTVFWQGVSLVRSSGWNEASKNYSYTIIDRDFCECDRILGVPSPTLVIKPFRGFSLNRGAQAISLVLAVFGR